MPAGKLITIEGIDGAGKSTLAHSLVGALRERDVSVELLREPGGVLLSERISALVKDPALTVSLARRGIALRRRPSRARPRALLPLLAAGTWVLLDRFVDSSLAYQGAGRQLGIEQVRAINLLATAGLVPDRTLLLRIAPTTGRARQNIREEAPDRLEREGEQFFGTIAAAYDALAAAEPERVRTIDAEQSASAVLDSALAEIADLFPSG